MPTNRVTMRQIRETLRLHLQAKLSYSEVGRALKISKSAVGKYVSLARAADVDWGLAQSLSDEDLEARLFRPAVPRSSHQLAPDFALIHQELKRAGVTLMLLWEEYARGNPLAYKYASFCIKYRAFAQAHAVSVKVNGGGHKAQAEAVRHGLSRAIIDLVPEQRKDLKVRGFLKRDPRAKERKKFGLKAARRAPQWSKR